MPHLTISLRLAVMAMCWLFVGSGISHAASTPQAGTTGKQAQPAIPADAPAGSRYWTPPSKRRKQPPRRPAIAPPTPPPNSLDKNKEAKPKESRSSGHGWHLNIEARTDAPLLIGGHIALEIPAGLRIASTFGVLPPFYVDMINLVLVGAEAYNQQTGDVIKETLSSSMVWRLHLGWRPFAQYGFYVEVGYGLITLGGSTSNTALLAAAVGQAIPPQLQGQLGQYKVNSSLHMFDAEIGYQWLFANNHLLFRLALGFAGTVASQTNVTPQNPNAINQQFAAQAATYLDNLYRSYVFTPTVSMGLGYRFF